jgi:hypothetical protein
LFLVLCGRAAKNIACYYRDLTCSIADVVPE